MSRHLAMLCTLAFAPGIAAAATWTVGHSGSEDFTSVREACGAAGAGDSILVSPGTYYEGEDGDFFNVESKPLAIIGLGMGADDTRVTAQIHVRNSVGTVFENLCFQTYSRLISYYAEISLRRCAFRDNLGTPVVLAMGEIAPTFLVEDCIFSGNGRGAIDAPYITVRRSLFVDNRRSIDGGGAISSVGAPDVWSTIEDCVFFRNEAPTGAAIMIGGRIEVRSCTLLDNRVTGDFGGAIDIGGDMYGSIHHCIIAGTENGYGVSCPGGAAVMECCDFWQNDLGATESDWYCPAPVELGNIFVDPLFCDPATGDVGLLEGSPCLPGNHGGYDCGLIGAKDVGCGIVATRQTTWGNLRFLFR